jgi:predicted AAA+ superfamily ATPase
VLSILRTPNSIAPVFDDIAYWSPTNSQVEVDFVLRRESKVLAIEAQSTKHYNTKMLKGLRAIGTLPELHKRILIYAGELSFRTEDGIHVWAVGEFLGSMTNGNLWD